MQQGDAGMKPAAWLANKAGILQLPSERKIYLFHWTELWAAGVCAVAPCEPSPSLPSAGFSHSSSLSNARTCSFIPSLPASVTHSPTAWLTVNSELLFGITRQGLCWCLHALLCRRPVAWAQWKLERKELNRPHKRFCMFYPDYSLL